jgi:hypothetical protein
MQGGKNCILPKEMNANRFFWDFNWLEIWSNHLCPSMGPNGGSVAGLRATKFKRGGEGGVTMVPHTKTLQVWKERNTNRHERQTCSTVEAPLCVNVSNSLCVSWQKIQGKSVKCAKSRISSTLVSCSCSKNVIYCYLYILCISTIQHYVPVYSSRIVLLDQYFSQVW